MSTTYPSDLSDAEWACVQRYLAPPSGRGTLRIHSLRRVLDAIFYVVRSGCPWRYLPDNFPPWQTVYYHYRQFCRTGLWTCLYRALRKAERLRVGRDPDPGAAIMDAQSVETMEESGCIRGCDAHKHVKGRKRHLLVDTLGLPLSFYVTPANVHDTFGARCLLAGLAYFVPRLKTIWADQAHQGSELAEYGYLVTFTAAQFQEGEQWDVSRAVTELAKALVKESEKPKKDFGELVRERRKARGLPVLLREHVLPELRGLCTRSHVAASALPVDGANRHDVEGEARLRARVAEFRVWEAYQALEEAEARMLSTSEVEKLERTYLHELATCEAARDAYHAPVGSAAPKEFAEHGG